MPRADTEAMNLHLIEVSRAVSSGAHAVLVVDGAEWHISDDLVVPSNISLLILPPYSPGLNPIENVWAYLRSNKLAHRLYETYTDIVDACCTAWNSFVEAPEIVRSITHRQWAMCQNI